MADWIGVGVAEKLAAEGAYVRLAVNGPCAAFSIQNYTRDAAIARLFKLGVETIPFMRLYGIDDRTAYFMHTPSQESLVLEDVDTVVCGLSRLAQRWRWPPIAGSSAFPFI